MDRIVSPGEIPISHFVLPELSVVQCVEDDRHVGTRIIRHKRHLTLISYFGHEDLRCLLRTSMHLGWLGARC
ncbi:MAG: hypothetical protein AUG49_15275 [Catenulispora sp. 13_1_20CM_3_70_7]|nr:MAG: hypothetical protein AUG49_15275 [Catenulispora sp. 13_1_20CM_3_70_7]